MRNKKSLGQLLSPATIRDLALPANYRYGEAIFRRNGVEFIEFGKEKVEAWVGGLTGGATEGGGQRRRTRLFMTRIGLGWHCAGNPRDHQIFCKHCVALALAILKIETGKKRRR